MASRKVKKWAYFGSFSIEWAILNCMTSVPTKTKNQKPKKKKNTCTHTQETNRPQFNNNNNNKTAWQENNKINKKAKNK